VEDDMTSGGVPATAQKLIILALIGGHD